MKIPTVPETLLKKRKKRSLAKAKEVRNAIKQRTALKAKKIRVFKRAEKYVKEYRQNERDVIRMKRQAKIHGNYYVPDQPQLAFVMRIRGLVKIP